jgi:hypothetical protein
MLVDFGPKKMLVSSTLQLTMVLLFSMGGLNGDALGAHIVPGPGMGTGLCILSQYVQVLH